MELWRLEKVKLLAKIDPEYPGEYARGVAAYRAGKYAISEDAFKKWLKDHPNGPFTLRAQNHLRAAIAAQSAPR